MEKKEAAHTKSSKAKKTKERSSSFETKGDKKQKKKKKKSEYAEMEGLGDTDLITDENEVRTITVFVWFVLSCLPLNQASSSYFRIVARFTLESLKGALPSVNS